APAPGPSTPGVPTAGAPSCEAAQSISLGRPGVSRLPALATFRTSGADVFVSASGFPHGGAFDPKVGSTLVYVGLADSPPSYDAQRDVVSHATTTVQVTENQHALLRLPTGRYWLLSSNTVRISLSACQKETVTDVVSNQ